MPIIICIWHSLPCKTGCTGGEDSYEKELLLLSPVAVKTKFQRQHISKELIESGFKKAVGMGYKAVLVDGALDDIEGVVDYSDYEALT